jgi:hypothetical protein
MLIVGAKGFAKEVLEVLFQSGTTDEIVFFDDLSSNISDYLYGRFLVLKNLESVKKYFQEVENCFTLGIGNPILRKKMCDKFENLGGVLTTIISPKADIGNFGNHIGSGCNIMTGSVITNDITIKKGTLINLKCTIGHD